MSILHTNISYEESFLIDLLFNCKKNLDKEINKGKIDYELLIKIASEHLMLPSLYLNLKIKGLLGLIPEDLKKYLEYIFEMNRNRNKILLKEVDEISKKLFEKKINHVFLKGASNLINGIYYDIGERMIGDIDILVSNEDFTKTIKLFNSSSSVKNSKKIFFESRHHPRVIDRNKTFALEIHNELLIKKNILDIKKLLLKKNTLNKVYNILSPYDDLIYNIYNFQLNDYGSYKLIYSFRSFYDTFKIIKNSNINPKKLKLDEYLSNYFMIAKELNILPLSKLDFKTNKLILGRFRLKKSFKIYYYFDNFLFEVLKRTSTFPKQINLLYKSRNYRKYALYKLKNMFLIKN